MREIEPHAGGVAAIHVPEEGIVDYPAVCETLARCLAVAGAKVVTHAAVTRLVRSRTRWIAKTGAGDFESDYIVNCAGLQCDRVCSLAGDKPKLQIIPFRGEYYRLKPDRQHLVRNLIYPVPDPRFPFLGVHFTRLIHGGIEAGPNAVLATAREGYKKTDFSTGFYRHLDLSRILALFSEIPTRLLRRVASVV
jgi:L-2-hydroxyglutarate oxidase